MNFKCAIFKLFFANIASLQKEVHEKMLRYKLLNIEEFYFFSEIIQN